MWLDVAAALNHMKMSIESLQPYEGSRTHMWICLQPLNVTPEFMLLQNNHTHICSHQTCQLLLVILPIYADNIDPGAYKAHITVCFHTL